VINLLKNIILLREVCYCEFSNNVLRTKSSFKIKIFMFIISTETINRKIQKISFYNDNKAFNMLKCLFLFLHEIHSDESDIVVSKSNKVL